MQQAVIVDALRTPMGRARQGIFRQVRAEALSGHLMQALLKRHPALPATEIDDIYWGCVQQSAEQGFNLARNAALLAGLPTSVPAVTVNRLCGSSMQALHDACRAIMVGDAQACLVGGVEQMGHLPMEQGVDFHPGLAHHISLGSTRMGLTAEYLARQFSISRAQQDAFALRSHRLAWQAQQAGRLAQEICPTPGHDAQGVPLLASQDEVIRADTSLAALAALPPVFDPQGSITAGNASALSDGAAALLVMSEARARELALPVLARVRAMTVVGCEPCLMGYGPVPASRLALKRAKLSLADVALVEINEAFAAQVLPCLRDLGLEEQLEDRVNRQGGAIALGHPLGCSGARILTSLVHQLRQTGGQFGLATMCIGLGQGISTLLEQV
ncbi:acetyl-CoA C-acyltransferase FadA [Pseudaeromonas sp. ZJS20]|uniref:acetyl-CoA C-acyltransferase FadA n=1 Tax=Pseudaeromonas aegiceratis TaxID=3153928 RepID=UPI00390C816D